ncbi:hypothetical protein D3C81_521360 [compost metagenome]
MEENIKNLEPSEVVKAVFALRGEERIFCQIDKAIGKQFKYASFKKDGMNNLFLSYMNTTNEQANQMSFDSFIDRYNQILEEEADLFDKIGYQYFGSELYKYLIDNSTPHEFYIDFENSFAVIYNKDEGTGPISGCSCGSCEAKKRK